MVSVAAPDAQRRLQAGQLRDADFEWIAPAGYEVSSHDGEIGLEVIGHAHGAAHVGGGDVAADVKVAELGDAQAIELSRQSADRQVDVMDAIVVPADEKTIGACSEGDRSRKRGGGLDKAA